MYPLKTSEKLWFLEIFQGYTNGSLAYSRVIQMDHWSKISQDDVSANGELTSF